MGKSGRSNPKKNKSARRRRPESTGRFTAGLLDPDTAARLGRASGGESPPEAVIPVVTTVLWAGILQGRPANMCVDGCLTIAHALACFGIRVELRAVDLAIQDRRTGRSLFRTRPRPHWEGTMLVGGHCVLTLPDHGRFIDPTIEQYPEVSSLKLGPIVGRPGGILSPHAPTMTPPPVTAERLPAGTPLAIIRDHLTLMYMIADDEITELITTSPWVRRLHEQHHRAGVNLASLVVRHFADVPEPARRANHPRLHALVATAATATDIETDTYGDIRFLIPAGDDHGLRLDELPLPVGTPPPAMVT